MRLEAMTVGMLRRALRIYQRETYGKADEVPVELTGEDDDPIESSLDVFVDESRRTGDAVRGLITKTPRRGWSMIRFDPGIIAELWELRRLVERHALEALLRDGLL